MWNISGLPTQGAVFSHRNTVGNVLWSCRERVTSTLVGGEFLPTLQPQRGAFSSGTMRGFRRSVLRALPEVLPITHSEFCEKYGGAKRRRYEAAKKTLEFSGLPRDAAHIRAFLKAEKWRESKAPRIISPRSPEYLLAVGVYIEPIEKLLYRAVAETVGHESIMKGFSLGDRASVLRSHWDSFLDPVAIGLDASKFDQHVSKAALEYEHGFYNGAYNSPELASLLSKQLRNVISASCEDGRVRWVTNGGRMSGDMNTALGNCLISAAMLYSYARERGIKIKAVVDGDDCVAVMERSDCATFLDGLVEWYLVKGFRMKVEETVDEFEQVVFCQGCPVLLSGSWRMVRNPLKAITQDHAWVEKGGISHADVLQATGEGGACLYGDCPVLGAYYRLLRGKHSLSRGAKREVIARSGWLRNYSNDYQQYTTVDSQARLSFWRAFGILPSEQIALEEYFSSFNLDAALTPFLHTTEEAPHVTEFIRQNIPISYDFTGSHQEFRFLI